MNKASVATPDMAQSQKNTSHADIASLEKALAGGRTPDLCYRLGCAYFSVGRDEDAVAILEEAAIINPSFHEAYAKLGEIVLKNGYRLEAMECYALAIEACPSEVRYKQDFIDTVKYLKVTSFSEGFKTTLETCFADKAVDLTDLWLTWFGLLKKDPAFAAFRKILNNAEYSAFCRGFDKIDDYSYLFSSFFQLGLKRLIVADILFERFLANLRRYLLLNDMAVMTGVVDRLSLVVALAEYCYCTEYILYATAEEQEEVDKLQKKIESSAEVDLLELSLFACYKPVHSLRNLSALSLPFNSPVGEILQVQVAHYLEEQEIKNNILSLTPVADRISVKVQEQYEEFPYPRWESFDPEIRSEMAEGHLLQGKNQILVAGCGTGKEAIELGAVFPESTILAIDLSRASLAYGIRRARQEGIHNVEFQQADILELGKIDRQFDYIASSGVLHHMDDPEKGWSTLTGLLKPGGLMRIALYSKIARKPVLEARQVIAEQGCAATAEAIREFRHEKFDQLNKHTRDRIARFMDYFYLSECRDLLFHVQEHQFDLLEIRDLLARLKLEFLQFYISDVVLQEFQKRNQDPAEQKDLAKWHEFEKRNPDIFAGMYRFWCRKREV